MALSSADRIIKAAVDCFSLQGSEVTMLEVATRAGVTRRTLYRAFPDRRALIEAVAVDRLDHIIHTVQPLLEAKAHLADALVTGFVEFIRHARADPVFIAALNEASDWQLERFLVGPNEQFAGRAASMWQKWTAQAGSTKEWRSGLDPEQVNAWLRAVAVILLLRDDLASDGQEQLLRSFVIPALVANPASAPVAASSKRRRSR